MGISWACVSVLSACDFLATQPHCICKVKEDWKQGSLQSYAHESAKNLRSDHEAINLIENGTSMLKETFQKRQAGELIIADLLDMEPDEYAALTTSSSEAQLAEGSLVIAGDGNGFSGADGSGDGGANMDSNSGSSSDATPQFTPEERASLAERLLTGFHRNAVQGEYLSELLSALYLMKDQALVHTRRKPVTSRPKLNFGFRNGDGDLPLYIWGQSLPNYGTIGDMPDILRPIFQIAANLCPEARDHNAIMLTFYLNGKQYFIPPHRDAAFSVNSSGAHEDSTPIIFFSFGVSRKLVFTDLAVPDSHHMADIEPHSILTLDFSHGDMFVLSGSDNLIVKHCIPADDTVELRTFFA